MESHEVSTSLRYPTREEALDKVTSSLSSSIDQACLSVMNYNSS